MDLSLVCLNNWRNLNKTKDLNKRMISLPTKWVAAHAERAGEAKLTGAAAVPPGEVLRQELSDIPTHRQDLLG